jgi:hypothetical protein
VDRLIRIRRGLERGDEIPMVEAWPQRMLQLQLSAVYISTVASKIQGSEWADGTALYYALHLTDLRRFSLFGLRNQPWFYETLSYYALVTEFSMATFVWSPRLRPYALLMGIGLHLGIEYAMTVPLFSYSMICCYLNFVPQAWIDSFVGWLPKRIGRPIEVPAGLRLPGSLPDMLTALDALHLVRPTGDARPVIDAAFVRRVFWRFPATWGFVMGPTALVLLIIPIRWFLLLFGIGWPLITLCLLQITAQRIAAEIAQESSVESSRTAFDDSSSLGDLTTASP